MIIINKDVNMKFFGGVDNLFIIDSEKIENDENIIEQILKEIELYPKK